MQVKWLENILLVNMYDCYMTLKMIGDLKSILIKKR